MAKRRISPLYLTVGAASRALSLHRKTLRQYLGAGILDGIRPVRRTAWYERQSTTGVGHWLISLDSIERLLTQLYMGKPVPKGVLKRLRLTAKSPKALGK